MDNESQRLAAAEERIKKHLWRQFGDSIAQNELKTMGPDGVDWVQRTATTIELLIPLIPATAIYLQREVSRRLNSASRILDLVTEGKVHLSKSTGGKSPIDPITEKWLIALEAATKETASLVTNIDSQHVSAETQRQILDVTCFGELLQKNGGSLYPDLYVKSRDYTMLPRQESKKKIDGPCLRKDNPSNVPDGCELKCNLGQRVKVDAHAPHPGLHIGVTWDLYGHQIAVNGVWVGYIRISDCREAARNVKATTVKYSFGHDLFVSALP